MKTKCSFILKSAVAIVLTVLMLLGSISSVIAATVDVAGSGASADLASTGGWPSPSSSNTYSVNNGITSVWGQNKGPTASYSGNTLSYDFYLKSTDTAFDVAFYCNGWGSDGRVVPKGGTQSKALTTTGQECEQGRNGTNGSWNVKPSTFCKSGYNYTKVTIKCDVSGYSWNGAMYYAASGVTNLSPTLSVPSTGTVGTAITLTGGLTDTGKIGTLTKTYQYSTNNGSTWNDLSSGSYTASSTGTVKFRYKVSDDGVKTSGTSVNGRTARVEYSSEQSCTFSAAATTYNNIAVAAKGSTDGSTFNTTLSGTPATISATSYTTGSSALTISAGTVSGYSFYKWVVTAGSGTIGTATSASTTFTPSASNTTVTAQYKKNYTFSNGTTDTHGTVTVPSGTKKAGDSYSGTVTPADGYKIKTLTVGGSAVSAAVGKTSAYTYNGTANGTSDTISVVATFEANTAMNLYIAGRFRVRPSEGSSSWTTTYSGTADWNATSTNIPFTYLSGTTYKVDTYATLAELSADIGSSSYTGNPVFFVYDKTETTEKNWHPSDATDMTTSGTTLQSSTDTNNMKFSSTSTDGPVTIYYDTNTHKIWYSIPNLYNVTVVDAIGGSVTASPSRTQENATVTLTIDPTTGYQLKSITAKDSSNASVTLSGTGNTRTFTMPAKDVTVTPVFEKISYAVSVDAKYSTNGTTFATDFPSGSKPAVTIAANTATQLDGVRVTAPATDPTGYVFAGWATNAGNTTTTYFANYLDKDTTFKPNASNTTAIARYKKLHTVTISVDNTGTGAGTATVSKNSVEAGGSYTITATAKSGSAIESVKVNGTAKTATASQTISSVSADQAVIVKFKSNIAIRGGSTIGTNWDSGDAMTSNAAGTEFTKAYTNVAGSSSGTSYEFKLHNGTSYSDDSSATVTITGGTSTGTMTTKAAAGVNWKLTLKKAANVTIKSDGTKITEIKVVPANATKYAVTFKKAANTTITGSYEGTNFTTASADATVQVYSGDEISFTVTADSGKYLSGLTTTAGTLSPAFAVGDSYTGKITNVTSARTVTPTVASKLSVAAKTNKSARGTVSVKESTAYPGESITITVSPKNGILKSLSATYANGVVYDCTVTGGSASNTWKKRTGTTAMAAPKLDLAGVGAYAALAALGASQTVTMTLQEDSAVTINATFDAYSAESTWYYNGYQSATDPKSAYWGKQMTEGVLSGEKFSYYHVEGRGSENYDQFFTVSNGKIDSGTRYVYFTQLKAGGWDYSHSPYAYFIGGTVAWHGTQMDWYTDNDMGQPVYRTAIPAGATGVVFNDGNTHKSTDITDLSAGGYYVDEYSTYTDGSSVHTGHTYTCSYPNAGTSSSGTEYKWGSGVYVDNFYSGGFYDQGSNVAKPKDNNGTNFADCKNDYYIVVLYPGKTYTIDYNGHTTTNTVDSDKPWVIWMSELPGDETVTIYAKDGAIRAETSGSTYANIADTKIYAADGTTHEGTGHTGNITNQTWETYKPAKGDTIVIKTQIGATDSGTLSDAAALKAKYYVRGFCVNGEVTELLEWNANGLYTMTYKIPEDIEDGAKIEITPIYYLKDTTANPIVTYRVTGFTDELKKVGSNTPNWGDTLYTYPFYGTYGGQNNAFGAYPGQPMVYYKGQYQMQIPQSDTAWDPYGTTIDAIKDTHVSGVTMSNGYFDIVHRQIMGYGDDSTSHDHVQTYDYGDFYKIFNEKKPVDNIVFDFKYRTKKHNLTDIITGSTTASDLTNKYGDTNGNGFELLTNFHGRTVDLFGTPLSGDAADPAKTKPLYVVSMGGVDGNVGVENIAGYYATEWNVYAPTTTTGTPASTDAYNRISGGGKNSIPPEVLVLNDDDTTSFNTTTYPSAVAEGSGSYNYAVTDWKTLYQNLEAYRGIPVLISYEMASMQVGAKIHTTSGAGGATRNDGRWLYSKNGENITSKIKIQYSDDNGATYTDLNTTTPQVQGLSAYFTNDGVEGQMTYSTTIDPDKTFDFEAKTTNGEYKFVGWYMEDGTKITSDNASHTERSGSYTFVAKFMQVQSGQLILSHSVDTDTTYKGAGTAKISAVVKDGDEVIRTYDLSTSDITLDDKIIKSDSTYTIDVTLEATATGNDTYGTTTLANPSGQDSTYFNAASTTTEGKTKTIVLNSFTVASLFSGTTQNVKNIIYHSYFTQAVFNYTLTFNYTDRFNASKSFTRQGTLTSAQVANETYVEKSGNIFSLLPAFIQTVAPHESNFGEDITWNINKSSFTQSGSTYTCTATITASQTEDTTRNVTFKLPYQHSNGIATVNGDKVGTAATTTDFALTDNNNNAVAFDTIPVLPDNGENGIYTDDTWKKWIAAPATINDNGTTKYFQYWSVKSTAADKDSDPEVARCYFQGFNFCALDNYTVTAIYGDESTNISNSGIYTGVSYLETSRNQWNDNKDRDKTESALASDLLFNDFILNYNYKGIDIYKGESDSNAIQELGVVVERVQELGINQDGSKDTNIAHYTSIAENRDAVNSVINGTSSDKKFTKDEIAKTALDNKNRIKFYEAFYNGKGWSMENQSSATKYAYRNYVFRAYTYIKYTDEQNNPQILLSDKPAYFTMYDEATANYVAPTTTTNGN